MIHSSILARTINCYASVLGFVTACQAGTFHAIRSSGDRAVPSIVARDVCAWPAMTRLEDGTLLIANFNQPSHGRMVGDVDTWASLDDGKSWEKRAPGAPHSPGTLSNRMNVAFGALPGGEVLLVASGWSLKLDASTPSGLQIDKILRPWVSRSLDGGRTWKIDRESFPEFSPGGGHQIPFGPVQAGASGDLLVPVYDNIPNPKTGKTKWTHVYVYRSRDRGKSWIDPVMIDAEASYNETALLHVGEGRWLAFCRTTHLVVYESPDDGRTWTKIGPATDKACYPANAIRLRDGRILLSYGNRMIGDPRVEAKVSADGGRTWSAPIRLVDVVAAPKPGLEDMGYPSSVQLADGSVLTAYYAKHSRLHDGYHLAVIQWDADRSFAVSSR
jgi:hypothetical protein